MTEPPDVPLGVLLTVLKRWENAELDAAEVLPIVRAAARRLNRVCWCGESSGVVTQTVCCMTHSRHIHPHNNCILR